MKGKNKKEEESVSIDAFEENSKIYDALRVVKVEKIPAYLRNNPNNLNAFVKLFAINEDIETVNFGKGTEIIFKAKSWWALLTVALN